MDNNRKQSKAMLRRINDVHVRTIVELNKNLTAAQDKIKRLESFIANFAKGER